MTSSLKGTVLLCHAVPLVTCLPAGLPAVRILATFHEAAVLGRVQSQIEVEVDVLVPRILLKWPQLNIEVHPFYPAKLACLVVDCPTAAIHPSACLPE